jgi:hypothetical protein
LVEISKQTNVGVSSNFDKSWCSLYGIPFKQISFSSSGDKNTGTKLTTPAQN